MSLPEPLPPARLPAPAPRWAAPFTRADVRVGDEERLAVVEALKTHYSEGRLRADELTLRTDAALAAATQGELQRLMSDLPRLASRGAVAAPGVAMLIATGALALALLPVVATAAVVSVVALLPGGLPFVPWLATFLVTAALAAVAGTYSFRGARARQRARRAGRRW